VRVRETTHKCGSTSDVIKAGHVLSPGNGHAREKWRLSQHLCQTLWIAVRGLGGFLADTSNASEKLIPVTTYRRRVLNIRSAQLDMFWPQVPIKCEVSLCNWLITPNHAVTTVTSSDLDRIGLPGPCDTLRWQQSRITQQLSRYFGSLNKNKKLVRGLMARLIDQEPHGSSFGKRQNERMLKSQCNAC
jgi:hypothetical protein